MKILCDPFGGGEDYYDVIVDDGQILVFDDIAGHYTVCHRLSEEKIEELKKVLKYYDC